MFIFPHLFCCDNELTCFWCWSASSEAFVSVPYVKSPKQAWRAAREPLRGCPCPRTHKRSSAHRVWCQYKWCATIVCSILLRPCMIDNHECRFRNVLDLVFFGMLGLLLHDCLNSLGFCRYFPGYSSLHHPYCAHKCLCVFLCVCVFGWLLTQFWMEHQRHSVDTLVITSETPPE